MADYAKLREQMVERQIAGRGISDPRILQAFRDVPRERFIGQEQAGEAYADNPLPIGCGQTISQPYIVALMIEAASISPGDRVLEIGAGSGYAAAVMSRIARQVIAVERHAELAQGAQARLAGLGYDDVTVIHADGSGGWPADAPYDAILAAASGSHVPAPLVEQLAPGGRIVMPVGEQDSVQTLVKVTKGRDGRLIEEDLGAVRFVPLVGERGWSE